MNKSGKSVLWFLGACLALTQLVVASLAAKVTYFDVPLVLLYSFVSLIIILLVLLLLFFTSPEHLLVESDDLVSLMMIKEAVKDMSPELAKTIVMDFSASTWVKPEVEEPAEEVESEEEEEVEEVEQVEPSIAELEKEREKLLKRIEELVKSG